MSSRKQYEEKVKQKLQELELEIEKLKAQLKEVEAELVPEHHEKFQELHALQNKAKQKFDELVEAGDDAFESLQENMEEYWSSLGREIKAFDIKFQDRK
jgi:chromosome segregation ATPase